MADTPQVDTSEARCRWMLAGQPSERCTLPELHGGAHKWEVIPDAQPVHVEGAAQDIIAQEVSRYRVLADWRVVYGEDGDYRGEVTIHRGELLATIKPPRAGVLMREYIRHEVLHIAMAAVKRARDPHEAEELLVQDLIKAASDVEGETQPLCFVCGQPWTRYPTDHRCPGQIMAEYHPAARGQQIDINAIWDRLPILLMLGVPAELLKPAWDWAMERLSPADDAETERPGIDT